MKHKKHFPTLFLVVTLSVAGLFFFNKSIVEARAINCDAEESHSDCLPGGGGPSIIETTARFTAPEDLPVWQPSMTVGTGASVTVEGGYGFTSSSNTTTIESCNLSINKEAALRLSAGWSIPSRNYVSNATSRGFAVNIPFVGTLTDTNANSDTFPVSSPTTWTYEGNTTDTLFSGSRDRSNHWTPGTFPIADGWEKASSKSWTFNAPTTPGTYTITVNGGIYEVRSGDQSRNCAISDVYSVHHESPKTLTLVVVQSTPVTVNISVPKVSAHNNNVESTMTHSDGTSYSDADSGNPNDGGSYWQYTHEYTLLGGSYALTFNNSYPRLSVGSVSWSDGGSGSSKVVSGSGTLTADVAYTYDSPTLALAENSGNNSLSWTVPTSPAVYNYWQVYRKVGNGSYSNITTSNLTNNPDRLFHSDRSYIDSAYNNSSNNLICYYVKGIIDAAYGRHSSLDKNSNEVCSAVATIDVVSNIDNARFVFSGIPATWTLANAGDKKSFIVRAPGDYSGYVVPQTVLGYGTPSVTWSPSDTPSVGDTSTATITYASVPTGTIAVEVVSSSNAPAVVFNLSGPDNWTTGDVTRNPGTSTYSNRNIGDYSVSVTGPGSSWSDVITPSATQTLGEGETKTFTVTRTAVNDCSITLDANRSWIDNDAAVQITTNPGASVPVNWSSQRVSGALSPSWGSTRGSSGAENLTAPTTPGSYVYTMTGTGTNGNSCTSNEFKIIVPTQTCDMIVTSDKATTFTIDGISGTKTIEANVATTYAIPGHVSDTRGLTPGSVFGYSSASWQTDSGNEGNPNPVCPKGGTVNVEIEHSAQAPSCSLTGTTSSVQAGANMAIQWDSSNISGTLTASTNPIWSDWSGSQLTSGTETSVTAPSGVGEYTLGLSGTHPDGTTGSCSAILTVTAAPPTTASVSVTTNSSSANWELRQDGVLAPEHQYMSGNDTITFTIPSGSTSDFSFSPEILADNVVSISNTKGGVTSVDQGTGISTSPMSGVGAGDSEGFTVSYSTTLGELKVTSNLANTSFAIDNAGTIRSFSGSGSISSANGTNTYVVVPGASGTSYTVTPGAKSGYNVSVTNTSVINRGGSNTFVITYTALNVPTATLSSSPNPVDYNSASTLTWSSTNATSCTGVGFNTNGATSGSVSTGNITTNQTYTMTCTGPDGTSPEASEIVNVNAQPTAIIEILSDVDVTYSVVPDDSPSNSMTNASASAGVVDSATAILPASGNRTYTIVPPADTGVVATISGVVVGSTSGTVSEGQTLRFELTYAAPPTPSAPVVSITSPLNGASYVTGDDISIEATASDSDGVISSVAFYNGTTLLSTDTTSPYSYTWQSVPEGTYSITAKATDNDSNETTSTAVGVTVSDIVGTAPVVSITSPLNGASYVTGDDISIEATASDSDGVISSVAFYNGTTLLSTDTTSPYSYTWQSVPEGTYSITAKATDNDSNETTSTAVGVTVSDIVGTAPSISMIKPADGTTYSNPAKIKLEAAASDDDGTISQVEFFYSNGGSYVSLGSDSRSPYKKTINNVPVGSYSIKAVATDNDGLTKESASISVSVQDPNTNSAIITIVSDRDTSARIMPRVGNVDVLAVNPSSVPVNVNDSGTLYTISTQEVDGEYPTVTNSITGASNSALLRPNQTLSFILDYPGPIGGNPECSDGVDNDLDGDTDYPDDKQCGSPSDISESGSAIPPRPECNDGIDNDADNEVDFDGYAGFVADSDCTSFSDDDESTPPPPPPSFSLEVVGKLEQKSPTGLGTTTSAIVRVVPHYGFSENVTLTYVSISPNLAGIAADFTDFELSSTEYGTGSKFVVGLSNEPREKNYTIRVRGRGAGGFVTESNVLLEIDSVSFLFFEEF